MNIDGSQEQNIGEERTVPIEQELHRSEPEETGHDQQYQQNVDYYVGTVCLPDLEIHRIMRESIERI